MAQGSRWLGGRIVVGALALLAAVAPPARAATIVQTTGGGIMTVTSVDFGSRAILRDGTRALAFTWQTASGVRRGFVPHTVDIAPDLSPSLTLDPRTGNPVLVWSRFDGVALKVSYARFERAGWRDIHFVTFGPGQDIGPTVGTSRSGSVLLWTDEDGRALHAPIDLSTGRLFAAPTFIHVGVPALNPGDGGISGGSGFRSEGATDAPVIIGNCVRTRNEPCNIPTLPNAIPGAPPPVPESPGSEGGSDVPVVVSMINPGSSTVAVTSDPGCDVQVVVVTSSGGRVLQIIELAATGGTRTLATLQVSISVSIRDAAATAGAFYLRALCDE